MRKLTSALFLAFLIPSLVFAQSADQPASSRATSSIQGNAQLSTVDLQRQIQDLLKQLQALQLQVAALQGELGKQTETKASTTEPSILTPTPEIQVAAPQAVPPELTRFLSRGSSGDDVRNLQEFLAKDKDVYPDGLVTGYFGPLTEAAVKRWQKKHGIESVGVIGPKTMAKFQELGKGRVQELIQEGAGQSGIIPQGLLTAPGIQSRLGISTTTTQQATTTSMPFTVSSTAGVATSAPLASSTTTTTTSTTATVSSAAYSGYYSAGYSAPVSSVTQTLSAASTTATSTVASTATSTTSTFSTSTTAASTTTASTTTTTYVSTGAVKILSPNGGEQWTKGQPHEVRWENPLQAGFSNTSYFDWEVYFKNGNTEYGSKGEGAQAAADTCRSVPITQSFCTATLTSTAIPDSSNFKAEILIGRNCPAGSPASCWDAPVPLAPGKDTDFSDNTFSIVSSALNIASSSTASDTIPPSVPTGLVASNTSPDILVYIRVSWTASTDNVGVMGYRVYRNGTQIGSVTGTVYDNPAGLVAGTTYSYTVAAYDAAGNVSSQSAPASATTLSAGPPAPTNVQTVTTSGSQSQPPQMWYYLTFNYTLQSTTQSFNVYRKRPTDASFVKYTYGAQTPVNPSILPLPGSNESNLYHRDPNQWQWWTTLLVPAPDTAAGEYKFYVTAVDANGIESNPSETKSFKLYVTPVITSPADGSTVSSPFTITVTGDPNVSSPTYGMALYKRTTGDTAWSAWPAPSTSFTYGGQTLNPNDNPHRLVVWFSSGAYDRSLFSTSIFNIENPAMSSTTASTSASVAGSKNFLASVLVSLSEVLSALRQLVR